MTQEELDAAYAKGLADGLARGLCSAASTVADSAKELVDGAKRLMAAWDESI